MHPTSRPPARRALGDKHQWQQLQHKLADGNRRMIRATAGELRRLPAQIRQQRRALLSEDKTDRGSRPAFRPTSKHVLNPLSNWVKYWDMWMGVMLVFTALVTPYQVAFLRPSILSAHRATPCCVSTCSSAVLPIRTSSRELPKACVSLKQLSSVPNAFTL